MRTKRIASWVGGAWSIALVACDFEYGVTRQAKLVRLPPADCVRSAIESTPGIESVRYSTSEGSRTITLTGLKPADQVHSFVYRGEGVEGVLQLVANYKGEVHFSDVLVGINRKPPQVLVDQTRRMMSTLETGLEARCNVSGLVASIRESCRGVECPHS
jgi:hypothetical protein